jgi:transcriptional regulator with XRE-family HTH domain
MTASDKLGSDKLGSDDLSAEERADADLRFRVLKILNAALRQSGITQAELATRLGVRRSAVNQVLRGDGNMHISRLAAYLHALGFEARIDLVPAGQSTRTPAPRDRPGRSPLTPSRMRTIRQKTITQRSAVGGRESAGREARLG